MKTRTHPALCLCLILAGPHAVHAEDAYYSVPLSSLTLTEGALPMNTAPSTGRDWQRMSMMQSYAVLDGPGEAYISGTGIQPWNTSPGRAAIPALSVRMPEGHDVTGRVYIPSETNAGMVQLRFRLAATDATPGAREAFLAAKDQFYRDLFTRDIPGAAWFRHQLELVSVERGTTLSNLNDSPVTWNRNRRPALEDTYGLFTGGRAMSENLQLDRTLDLRGESGGESIDLTNLTGITVRPMDWTTLLREPKPELDPLAAFIPADQHAIFFPSFQAMTDAIDEAAANGAPVLELLEPRAQETGSRERYQHQLCLDLSDLSRLLGPQVVAATAFTGSDPYLRVGTDFAVLFEARNPDLLQASIAARQSAACAGNAAEAVSGEIDGVQYRGAVSPDRHVCSYMAAVSNFVFVANSRQQLQNLIRTAQGKTAALGAQDEYVFFRQRYPRDATNESALLILTDATIRRWCGPQWRIADSRRTRAAAVLAELQAANADGLIRTGTGGATLRSEYSGPDLGEVRLTPAGVVSSTYGTLDFMTPIAELGITRVTTNEARAYEVWRQGYQSNWRQAFDPIALRLSISKGRLAADLTVMPLILATDFNSIREFSLGSEMTPTGGDPHGNALARVSFAVNARSAPVQEAGNFIGTMAPGLKANFLSWLGQSVTVYTDDDSYWDELLASTDTDEFMESAFERLPVALHCDVKNPLGVAAFLTAVHAFANQSAPGMLVWENLDHQGKPYVKVSARPQSEQGRPGEAWTVCYAVTPDALTVTLNEGVLKRALNRQLERAGTNAAPASRIGPWLGTSFGLQLERKFIDVLAKAFTDEYQRHLRELAWNNLPILNEWKRQFPERNPMKVHEQLWGMKLRCPGGGQYVWNEQWQTMESTVFGHPGAPTATATALAPNVLDVNLGVTFEGQGLSASGVIQRKPAP